MTRTMRRAATPDLSAVTGLLTARADWLQSKGHDQWSVRDPTRTAAATIDAGETWLLTDDATSEHLGTITWSTTADLDFWTPSELAQPAIYLSKMATRPDQRGRGLGALLVYAAWRYAQQHGIGLLRWDAWRTNPGLQNYYRQLGATAVRTAVVPGRNSGALFEWTCPDLVSGTDLTNVVQLEAPAGHIGEVDSIARHSPPTVLGDVEAYGGAPPEPAHWHEVPGLVAADINADASARPQPLTVMPGGSGPLLFHSGDIWRAHHLWSREVAGPELTRLTPGRPYRLEHVQRGTACHVALASDLVAGAAD